MQATGIFYITLGLLTVLPLILFNLRRIFVKKPPAPLKINWARGAVVLLISGFLVFFLFSAYTVTLHERYEITLEQVAEKHAEYLLGKESAEDFQRFLTENGTESIGASFDSLELGSAASDKTVKFQLSNWCIPKYWQGVDGFEQVEVLSEENPIYLMYLLEYDGQQAYYAIRMVETEDGWLYDWIGKANEQQQKTIKMPTQKNGKWYTVTA